MKYSNLITQEELRGVSPYLSAPSVDGDLYLEKVILQGQDFPVYFVCRHTKNPKFKWFCIHNNYEGIVLVIPVRIEYLIECIKGRLSLFDLSTLWGKETLIYKFQDNLPYRVTGYELSTITKYLPPEHSFIDDDWMRDEHLEEYVQQLKRELKNIPIDIVGSKAVDK